MRKLLVLMSHDLTPQQIEAARIELGILEIRILPDELREKWMQVDPLEDFSEELLEPVLTWITSSSQPGDAVLVHGEPGMQQAVVLHAGARDRVPVYSTTRRESVEEVAPDGSVRKVSRFAHVRFREYPRELEQRCWSCGSKRCQYPEIHY